VCAYVSKCGYNAVQFQNERFFLNGLRPERRECAAALTSCGGYDEVEGVDEQSILQ